MPTAVTSTFITSYQHLGGGRIGVLALGVPPVAQTIGGKLRCVSTRAEIDKFPIEFEIVNPMGNNHLLGIAVEIIVQGLNFSDGVYNRRRIQIADIFLFLCVNTDDTVVRSKVSIR